MKKPPSLLDEGFAEVEKRRRAILYEGFFVGSYMDDDAPEQGGLESAPPSIPIVVGNLGDVALVQEPVEEKTPWEDIAQSSDSGQKSELIAPGAWPSPAGVARNNRLILATVVFFVSLFFSWGWWHWVALFWYGGYYYEGESLSGWIELLDLFDFIISGYLFDDFAYGIAEVGPAYVFFIARAFMPLVLIGVLVFAWVKRNSGQAVFRKIGMFGGGYFAVMAIMLLYTILEPLRLLRFGDMFLTSFGFWLAGGSMLLLHPKLIPLPEQYRVQWHLLGSQQHLEIPQISASGEPATQLYGHISSLEMPMPAENEGTGKSLIIPGISLGAWVFILIGIMTGEDEMAVFCFGWMFFIPVHLGGIIYEMRRAGWAFTVPFLRTIAYSVPFAIWQYFNTLRNYSWSFFGESSSNEAFVVPFFAIGGYIIGRFIWSMYGDLQSRRGTWYALPLCGVLFMLGFLLAW